MLKIEQLDNDTYIIDGKQYVKVPCITVVEVKHLGNRSKPFLFECGYEELKSKLHPNQYVVCETMRGDCVGIICEVKEMQIYEARLKGAYFPLKKVLRLAMPEEIIKAYENIGTTIPF